MITHDLSIDYLKSRFERNQIDSVQIPTFDSFEEFKNVFKNLEENLKIRGQFLFAILKVMFRLINKNHAMIKLMIDADRFLMSMEKRRKVCCEKYSQFFDNQELESLKKEMFNLRVECIRGAGGVVFYKE